MLTAMNLRDKFAALGADDPEGLAHLEVTENIPHLARLRFLRGMWSIVDRYGQSTGMVHDTGEAARERLLALGADPADLQAFARMVAHESVFSALCFLDDPAGDVDAPELPGWSLIERHGDELTGRPVQALYEDMGPDR
jgi:hypothetical protein